MKRLNNIYLSGSALNEEDYEEDGFRWEDCSSEDKLLYAIRRSSKKESMIAVFNFGSEKQSGYTIELEDGEKPELLLFSDDSSFGGNSDPSSLYNTDGNKISFDLPGYSAALIKV